MPTILSLNFKSVMPHALFLLSPTTSISYMYSGYVLFCNNSTFGQCLSKRLYTCTDSNKNEVQQIKRGSVLFMFNPETKTIVGPFTAAAEGATKIETGTWDSDVDEHSASANIKLEWENPHKIEKADERFPFLKNPTKCELSPLWIHTLLDALKEAPIFEG